MTGKWSERVSHGEEENPNRRTPKLSAEVTPRDLACKLPLFIYPLLEEVRFWRSKKTFDFAKLIVWPDSLQNI